MGGLAVIFEENLAMAWDSPAVAKKYRIKMKEEEQERDREQKNSGKESKKKLIRGSIRGHTTAVTWRQREFPFVNGR